MGHVRSADGTTIAYEVTGSGPAVILVDGAMCYRASNGQRPLAEKLADHFTVYVYDRRGRGESGDTAPYAPEREVEDIAALIETAGGSASLAGVSSGAVLVLRAAAAGLPVERIAIYEPPFAIDAAVLAEQQVALAGMETELVAGRRSAAVQTFLRLVGVPAVGRYMMRLFPMYKQMTGIAHTLPYDQRIIGATGTAPVLEAQPWAGITAPTLVMAGGKSPETALVAPGRGVAEQVPGARFEILPGQTHMVSPAALAPALIGFLSTGDQRPGTDSNPGSNVARAVTEAAAE